MSVTSPAVARAPDGLRRRFTARVAAASLPRAPGPDRIVTTEQLAELPPVVQRYLRFIDEAGAPTDFATTDRYAALPSGLLRTEWHTPVQGWQRIDGRAVPHLVQAVWHFPTGEQPYIKGRFPSENIHFNL